MKKRWLPKGVDQYRDQHGKLRTRARRKGWGTHYFVSEPGSDAFMAEYRSWLARTSSSNPPIGMTRERRGSVSDAVARYYRSAEWAVLSASTKNTYRGILERFRVEHGDKPIADLRREHIKRIIAAKAATPGAANNLLKLLRVLLHFAIDDGMRPDDPTLGVKPLRIKSEGFHTWTEDEIAAFEATHPIGSRTRLAFGLMLYTGQRRSDIVTMGRQHVRGDRISVRQIKTTALLDIRIHPTLKRILDAASTANLTFLITEYGRPFTAKGFGGWFRHACDSAGLPACSAHGLRKAAARRMAEAGCSPSEIAAVTGHKSLREVARYTSAADQAHLADSAISKVARAEEERNLANQRDRLAKTGEK